MKTYNAKIKLGTAGDMSTQWWTQEDWDKHTKYVEQLKLDGRYLKEEEFSLTMEHIPEFDDIKTVKSNYSFKIIDFSKI